MTVGGGLLLATCCDSDCNTCDKDRSHDLKERNEGEGVKYINIMSSIETSVS